MLLVDTHVHVIAREGDANYPRAESAARTPWVVSNAVDLEALLPRLRRAEVDKAVLVQAISGHAFDNSYTADCARSLPDRFTSVGALDYAATGAVTTLRNWVEKNGIRGARLRPETDQTLDDPRTLPVWQACEELGIPVVVVGLSPALYPQLTAALDRFPGVKVALDHLAGNPVEGGPPFTQAQPLFELARYPNLYLKYTTTMFEACRAAEVVPHEFFGQLIEHFGAERLMWGSNYPANHEPEWPYETTAAVAREMAAHFAEGEQRLVLREAALALWPELAP